MFRVLNIGNIFDKWNLNDSKVSKSERLERAVSNFFPKECRWKCNCDDDLSAYDKEYLPFNTRNDYWLATMIQKDAELYDIDINEILDFVEISLFFERERSEYEERVIRWQIEWMMSTGSGFIDENCSESLNPLEYDVEFRNRLVSSLSVTSIDSDKIEVCIEKYAYLWRSQCMEICFANSFNPLGYIAPCVIDENHKENWLKIRKYEYYQRHKRIIDRCGIFFEEMQLGVDEINRLYEYLLMKKDERLDQIRKCENKIKLISLKMH